MAEDPANNPAPKGGPKWGTVRAQNVLRVPRAWMLPLAIPVIIIGLVTAIYIGSVIDPADHLQGLPVVVVDQDAGAQGPTGHLDLGQSLVHVLESSPEVTSKLALDVTSLANAETTMNRGGAYVAVVIPATFTASALLDAGYAAQPGTHPPTTPDVELLENLRLGSLGVNLAAGVITPAVDDASKALGSALAAQSTAAVKSNAELAAQVSDPIRLLPTSYRPLPSRSALGLSAFYVSLIAILAGFLAGTVINSSMDAALGYAATDLGPKWKFRMPLPITRRQTLLAKWSMGAVAAPILAAVILVIAVGGFAMYAPNFGILWLLLSLTTFMVATGTLALLAAFGSFGQLLAMVLILYLSLASSGGTVPTQALPGFFRVVGQVEPLRQTLGGAREVLYFGAQWQAGLSQAVVVLCAELAFFAVLGLLVVSWYDRRNLYRIQPEILSYVQRAVAERAAS
ncbi:MAG TPA: ABC transporter permease [Acidimicrobiales bacterium]|nr:ABC transporter permease [Acidimicrobiales bacterium]